jgi:hypothetical protein
MWILTKMAEKHKKTVLTAKQKLELIEKYEKGESAIKLAKGYGIGIQTVRDIKNNKIMSMGFVRDCNSGARPSNHTSMENSSCEEVDLPFFSGSTRSEQKEYQSLVPCVHRRSSFFIKLWDWMVSSMPLLDGSPDSSNYMIFVKLLFRNRDFMVPMMLQLIHSA